MDPDTREIRVTFDQPMGKSYSWIGVDDFMSGQPEWKDAKTCVLPVKLKPETEYWLSLNTNRFSNFRSQKGESAVPFPVSFRTSGSGIPANKLTAEQNRKSIDQLQRAILTSYSYRDRIVKGWGNQFARHEPTLLSASTPSEFAGAAASLLENARDVHIWMKVGTGVVGTYQRSVHSNCNLDLLPKLPGWKMHNPVVGTARPGDYVKYLLVKTWSIDHESVLKPALDLVERCRPNDTLILDVRPNAGGSEFKARVLAGCFVTDKIVYSKNRNIVAGGPDRFTRIFDRILEPNPDRKTFAGKKVIVLMGQRNMSSCESFILMMRQVPHVVLMGQQTYGSSGNPKPHLLENGVTVYLPSWQAYDETGASLEGVGITPDVAIASQDSDFEKRDPVLAKAIEMAR